MQLVQLSPLPCCSTAAMLLPIGYLQSLTLILALQLRTHLASSFPHLLHCFEAAGDINNALAITQELVQPLGSASEQRAVVGGMLSSLLAEPVVEVARQWVSINLLGHAKCPTAYCARNDTVICFVTLSLDMSSLLHNPCSHVHTSRLHTCLLACQLYQSAQLYIAGAASMYT